MKILTTLFLILLVGFTQAYHSDDCIGKNPTQYGALMDLYHATQGDNWLWSFGQAWTATPNYCRWAGVMCASLFEKVLGCDYVISLEMQGFELNGTLPASLADLTGLSHLDLSWNPLLTGELPANLFAEMEDLYWLDLSYTQLTGTLSSPEYCNLGTVNAEGSNFNQVSLSGCGGIKNLKLGQNQLLEFSDLCQLPELEYLSLRDNQLTEPTTNLTCLCQMTYLIELDLSGNRFEAAPPSCWGELPNLQQLLLGNNSFTSFPANGRFPELRELDLSFNHLAHDPLLVSPGNQETSYLWSYWTGFDSLCSELFAGFPSLFNGHLQSLDLRHNPELRGNKTECFEFSENKYFTEGNYNCWVAYFISQDRSPPLRIYLPVLYFDPRSHCW